MPSPWNTFRHSTDVQPFLCTRGLVIRVYHNVRYYRASLDVSLKERFAGRVTAHSHPRHTADLSAHGRSLPAWWLGCGLTSEFTAKPRAPSVHCLLYGAELKVPPIVNTRVFVLSFASSSGCISLLLIKTSAIRTCSRFYSVISDKNAWMLSYTLLRLFSFFRNFHLHLSSQQALTSLCSCEGVIKWTTNHVTERCTITFREGFFFSSLHNFTKLHRPGVFTLPNRPSGNYMNHLLW
jgi:hypothetical protein